MSKTISIKEDDVSRNFTVEKLRTKLQAGGTCDWIPEDEINDYVELEELNVTENGTYTPQTKVGFSSVYVEVSGGGGQGGGPEGIRTVQAVATEAISALDTVYVIERSEGGEASEVQSAVTGDTSAEVAYDPGAKEMYFHLRNASEVRKTPISDISGQGSVAMPVSASLTRTLIGYTDPSPASSSEKYVFLNLANGRTYKHGGSTSYASAPKISHSAGYFTIPNTGVSMESMTKIITYQSTTANSSKIYSDTDSVYNGTQGKYYIHRNGSNIGEYTININQRTGHDAFNIIGNKIIFVDTTQNSSGKYDIGWIEIGDTTFHKIDGLEAETTTPIIKFNAEGTILHIQLGGQAGMALLYPDMTYVVYSNITGTPSKSAEMFDSYYWFPTLGKMYYIPQTAVMGKTSDKDHAGALGYVKDDIAQGANGTAIVLFD